MEKFLLFSPSVLYVVCNICTERKAITQPLCKQLKIIISLISRSQSGQSGQSGRELIGMFCLATLLVRRPPLLLNQVQINGNTSVTRFTTGPTE